MSYVSAADTPCKNGTFQAPQPIYNLDCSFVVPESAIGLGISGISTFGIFTSVLYSIGFIWYREKVAVKAATFEVCLVIFFGSILMCVSVFLKAGAPSHALCIARPWFLVLGFATFFGGFLIKMVRVDVIFRSGRAGRLPSPKQLSLLTMLQQLGIILVFEIGSLIALSIIDSPGAIRTTIELRGVGSYTEMRCKPFHQIPVVLLFAINAMLIIYGCFIAWKCRNVPDAYNETKFIMVAMLLISFTAVAVVPVTLVMSNAQAVYLLEGLGINFATTVSVGIFAIPKLWMAYMNIIPKRTDFEASENNMNRTRGENGNNTRGAPPARTAAAAGTVATHNSSEKLFVPLNDLKPKHRHGVIMHESPINQGTASE
ncbi:hypothetical protein HK102_011570 [Quaeritorhiza haematococci]|nr:hypothetical protein HK102_011570 [Quaeritorhiza haematococci]